MLVLPGRIVITLFDKENAFYKSCCNEGLIKYVSGFKHNTSSSLGILIGGWRKTTSGLILLISRKFLFILTMLSAA